ncbi:MAG: sugar phosphate isomerase/epimerase [candidate division Zixibacteria bacterium]|nr:sugar phosphate isomerase/epimerase [candidate division Zixibacteria bacterium]
MLSVSTSWNALRIPSGGDIVREVKKLGLNSIELNYQANADQFDEINRLKKQGEITISSLHNICPLPEGADPVTAHRLSSFTSPDKSVREEAVKLTLKTIDNAAELEAGAVVLHLGEMWNNPLVEMERAYVTARIKGRQPQEKIDEMKSRLMEIRKEYSIPGLARINDSLAILIKHAESQNIKLGIENRYWYTQFPNPDELELLFNDFNSPMVGLWFDVGHSATLEYMNYIGKDEILQRFSGRLIGTHLMDCIRNSDHLAPGKGKVDFSYLASVVKPQTMKIIEPAVHITFQDMQEGVAFLQKSGLG